MKKDETQHADAGATPALTVTDGGTSKIKRLSALDIKKADDVQTRDVFVPEWGGVVTLKTLTTRDKDAYELRQERDAEGKLIDKVVRAWLVAYCMVNEHDERVIPDDQVEWFATKSAKVMDRLYAICNEMNTVTQSAQDTVVKNSDAGQHDAS